MHERVLECESGVKYGTPWFEMFLCILENEKVDFVVPFQEF